MPNTRQRRSKEYGEKIKESLNRKTISDVRLPLLNDKDERYHILVKFENGVEVKWYMKNNLKFDEIKFENGGIDRFTGTELSLVDDKASKDILVFTFNILNNHNVYGGQIEEIKNIFQQYLNTL